MSYAFEVQIAQEDERSITVKTNADGSRAAAKQLHLYAGLWPWRWDFYLYKVELLRLRYEKRWIWPDVRETFSSKVLTVRQPLFSLSFYEPQEDFSISDGEYEPEVEDAEEIRIDELTERLPNVEFPINPSLEEIARLAFPVTGEERRQAATRAANRLRAGGKKKAAAGRRPKTGDTRRQHPRLQPRRRLGGPEGKRPLPQSPWQLRKHIARPQRAARAGALGKTKHLCQGLYLAGGDYGEIILPDEQEFRGNKSVIEDVITL